MAEAILSLDTRGPKVRRQGPDWSQCLCHVRPVTEKVTSFTAQSWAKLKESSEARQDSIYHELKTFWNEGPS